MKKIINALISVYDKENLEVFAKGLLEELVNIISTGGTAKILEKAGIATTKVEDVTDFPEILDGRVKTLNPKIHGGILAVRGNKKHIEVLESLKIPQVDLVVVNLYPFEEIREKSCGDEDKIIENFQKIISGDLKPDKKKEWLLADMYGFDAQFKPSCTCMYTANEQALAELVIRFSD